MSFVITVQPIYSAAMKQQRSYYHLILAVAVFTTPTLCNQPMCPKDGSLTIVQEPALASRSSGQTRLTCTMYRPENDFQVLVWTTVEFNKNIFTYVEGEKSGEIVGSQVVEADYDLGWNPGVSYVLLNTDLTDIHEYKCEFYLMDHTACMSQTAITFEGGYKNIVSTQLLLHFVKATPCPVPNYPT